MVSDSQLISHDTRVAVLYDRLGPYHHARLRALAPKLSLTAIEFSLTDDTYAWDVICESYGFQRITLFIDKPIALHSPEKISKRLKSVLYELDPDVVVIPGWDAPAALIALQWCVQTCTPSVLLSDSQKIDKNRSYWKEFVKSRIVRLHSSGFVGGVLHASYLESLGMPRERISIGCDVVDNSFFFGAAEEARLDETTREKLNLPANYFLASGRFVTKKNFGLLLRAYADYRRLVGSSAWSLVVLGDGPLKLCIQRLVQELDLNGKVLLPGFKQYSELPAYYAFAGAFVHASSSEQWGLVINEAMACGLTLIVSSSCGCVPELVQDGANGYIFNPTDIEGLARCLSHVSSADCDRQKMGRKSRLIINDFNPESYACNLLKAVSKGRMCYRKPFLIFDKLLLWLLINKPRFIKK